MSNNRGDNGFSGITDIIRGVGKLIKNAADIVDTSTGRRRISGESQKTDVPGSLNIRYDFFVKMGLDEKINTYSSAKPVLCIPQADIRQEDVRREDAVGKEASDVRQEDAEGKEASDVRREGVE